jgi:hypothetical protein
MYASYILISYLNFRVVADFVLDFAQSIRLVGNLIVNVNIEKFKSARCELYKQQLR